MQSQNGGWDGNSNGDWDGNGWNGNGGRGNGWNGNGGRGNGWNGNGGRGNGWNGNGGRGNGWNGNGWNGNGGRGNGWNGNGGRGNGGWNGNGGRGNGGWNDNGGRGNGGWTWAIERDIERDIEQAVARALAPIAASAIAISPADYLKELEKLNSDVSFIDTHCHLDILFKQTCFRKISHSAYQKLHQSSYPSCYEGCVAVFSDPKTFKEDTWKEILEEDKVWAAFGCHPHNANSYSYKIENDMKIALKHEKVVALGEIGLDYSSRNYSNRQTQKKVFRRQLKLAKQLNLPVVIHSRDAAKDTLKIMKQILPRDFKIHRHCFTTDWTEAQIWLKEFTNLYLGLTNLVTFEDAVELHEVARKIPLEKLLLETDAPYFVPRLESKGNRRSHPGMAIHVALQVASLRSEPLETILKSTRENTKNMYGI